MRYLNFFILTFLLKCSNIHGQTSRECKCDLKFSIADKSFDDLTRNFMTSAADGRDLCDYKCVEWCSKEIRATIGGDPNIVTNQGRENMCDLVSPNKAVFKDGIKMIGEWNYVGCTLNKIVLQDNVCCRHCQCKISFLEQKKINNFDNAIEVVDLSNRILKQRNFFCDKLDHLNECETDCRELVSQELNYDIVNEIGLDNYDPIANRRDSDKICEYLNRTINSPGIDLRVRIETGPRNESVHKDIDLGNICCNRTCNCDLIYKSSTLNSSKTTSYVINIEEFLPKRPLSYYCDDEVDECVEDCKIAAGIKLRNEEIKKPDVSVLDLEIFRNSLTARRTCLVYKRLATRPNGVDVYLRYGTGYGFKEKYPYSQEMLLGKLCCYTYFGIEWFPFNKCTDWLQGELQMELFDE